LSCRRKIDDEDLDGKLRCCLSPGLPQTHCKFFFFADFRSLKQEVSKVFHQSTKPRSIHTTAWRDHLISLPISESATRPPPNPSKKSSKSAATSQWIQLGDVSRNKIK
jgi:hypothetical protein